MKIKDLFGICFYYWYGSGPHSTPGKLPLSVQGTKLVNADGKVVTTIDATYGFKVHRAFVDSWILVPETTSTNQSFTIQTNPTTNGNFYYDDYFKLMKANGITNIMCVTGLMDHMKVAGYSQRKSACYDHSLDPSNPAAWKDYAHLWRLIATYYKDKDFKPDYYQLGNELDFRWSVMRILTPEEFTVGQWECIKAILEVDPTANIMLGSTLTPVIDTFNRIITKLKSLAQAEGKQVPKKLTLSFSHYIRNSGGNQGAGIADTPESQWNQTYNFYSALDNLCTQEDFYFFCCEAGNSTSTSTSVAALKQKAPTLEGVSHEDAQGVLAIRHALMVSSFKRCKGITFYHCKDGYEAEPFTYIGFNYDKDFGGKPDWSSKPGKTVIYDFLSEYGEWEVDNFNKSSTIYSCKLYKDFDMTTLAWTDKVNSRNYTPMPKETVTPVPVKPLVEVNIQGDLSKVQIKIQ